MHGHLTKFEPITELLNVRQMELLVFVCDVPSPWALKSANMDDKPANFCWMCVTSTANFD